MEPKIQWASSWRFTRNNLLLNSHLLTGSCIQQHITWQQHVAQYSSRANIGPLQSPAWHADEPFHLVAFDSQDKSSLVEIMFIYIFLITCLCGDLSMNSALAKPFASQMFHLGRFMHLYDFTLKNHTCLDQAHLYTINRIMPYKTPSSLALACWRLPQCPAVLPQWHVGASLCGGQGRKSHSLWSPDISCRWM